MIRSQFSKFRRSAQLIR